MSNLTTETISPNTTSGGPTPDTFTRPFAYGVCCATCICIGGTLLQWVPRDYFDEKLLAATHINSDLEADLFSEQKRSFYWMNSCRLQLELTLLHIEHFNAFSDADQAEVERLSVSIDEQNRIWDEYLLTPPPETTLKDVDPQELQRLEEKLRALEESHQPINRLKSTTN